MPISFSPDADALAREDLLKKYLKVRKTFRGGNFLAEVTDSYRMMKRPVDSLFVGLTDFIRKVKRYRKLTNPRQYAKAIGSAYLSWSFGWAPLFRDVVDASEAVARLSTSGRFDGKLINGKGVYSTSTEYDVGSFDVGLIDLHRFDKMRSEVAYRALIKARPDSFWTFADSFGVHYGDILPAVWEAVPWSFFVDYFVNCNAKIDAMQWAAADVGWVMRRTRTERFIHHALTISSDLPDGVVGRCSVSPMVRRATLVTRGASGIPYPPWRWKLPSFMQQYNIAALTAQILGSKPSRFTPPPSLEELKWRGRRNARR
jgi:hypothetical protein